MTAETYSEKSSRLSKLLEQIAHDDLAFLEDKPYLLKIRDCVGTVTVVAEVDHPPYQFVGIWVATVEGLEKAESEGGDLRDRIAKVNVTADCADLVLKAIQSTFGKDLLEEQLDDYKVTKDLRDGLISWIWQAWKRVDSGRGWVEYYSFAGVKDLIVRDEGVAHIQNLFFKGGWGDSSEPRFEVGDYVDSKVLKKNTKKNYEATQTGADNLNRAMKLVFEKSGYFSKIEGK